MLTIQDIESAANRIEKFVMESPVITSEYVNDLVRRKVYFKCENTQETGSFKVRGIFNKILSMKERGRIFKGMVTHSTGNHGIALAWIAKKMNIPAIVVLPNDASQYKSDAIRRYGGTIVYCDASPKACIEECNRLASEKNYEVIAPYDDLDVIAGQGTIGLEFCKQVPHLDAVLISVGGGGLFAGIATAMKSERENIKLYCVESEGKHLEESLKSGELISSDTSEFIKSVADGIRYPIAGEKTFPYLKKYAEKTVFTLNNEEIILGTKQTFDHVKQVVEPAAGCCLAALFKYNDVILNNADNVGIILSGGNIDIDHLPW